jgi:hypothetical protein
MKRVMLPTMPLCAILTLFAMTTFIGRAAADCQQNCSAQYDTCLKGCRSISDESQASSCVRGCMRGYEGCKRRCSSSGANKEFPEKATIGMQDSSDWIREATGRAAINGLENGKVIPVCAQPPHSCESNADCECSHCCAQLGEGGPHLCQPSC